MSEFRVAGYCRKALEFSMKIELSGGSLEDRIWRETEEGLAHEVSEGDEDSGDWATSHAWDSLAESLAEVYPCSESWSGAEFKGYRLIRLVEDVSRQDRIWSVVWSLFALLSV